MCLMYVQQHKEVSLREIEELFLSDSQMYLTGKINTMFTLEIYHSEETKEQNNELELILLVRSGGMDIVLHGEAYSLDHVIRCFGIDCEKSIWLVNKERPIGVRRTMD